MKSRSKIYCPPSINELRSARDRKRRLRLWLAFSLLGASVVAGVAWLVGGALV